MSGISLLALIWVIISCIAVAAVNNNSKPITKSRTVIVIAGNFSLGNELVNIAEYDISSGEWVSQYSADLYLYGAANGIILDMAINRTMGTMSNLFAVGEFDSVSELSQTQFCSVSGWDGLHFNKVGEGLCPRGVEDTSIIANTVVIGSGGDIYVGGNFESRVWNGKQFVEANYVAQFNAALDLWLPLWGSSLNCSTCGNPMVQSLAWDATLQELYIGGNFDAIGSNRISPGLAIWSSKLGLHGIPNSLYLTSYQMGLSSMFAPGIATQVAFEPVSESLFVAGNFLSVGGVDCSNIAVWFRGFNKWRCLNQPTRAMFPVSAMLLGGSLLFLAGAASGTADWPQSPPTLYTISVLDISGLIEEIVDSVHFPSVNGSGNATHASYRRRFGRASSPSWFNLEEPANRHHRQLMSHTRHKSIDSHKFRASSSSRDGQMMSKRRLQGSSVQNPHNNYSTPSSAPPPWVPNWNWLGGFHGQNGPVLRMSRGTDEYSDILVIAGAFSNGPPVLLWSIRGGFQINHQDGPGPLQGLVTAAGFAELPYFYYPPPDKHQSLESISGTMLIIILCLLLGVVVGVFSTVGCSSSYLYSTVPKEDYDVETGHLDDKHGDDESFSLSLSWLDGAGGSIEFRECFEKAMKARHLPANSESLLMIDPQEITLDKIIGEGSFGRVWSGQWRNNSVAVKEFVFAQTAIVGESIQKNNIIQEIVGEAGIMALMHHPKLLNLYGCSLTLQAIWIVSELCVLGSLRMVLDSTTPLTRLQMISLSLDIADGMLYMHTRNPPILHRDLKSHNIFVTRNFTDNSLVAKIGDWGSARAIALSGVKSMTHGVGTACWLAPEVINHDVFSKESDVYAFGIVLWEIFTRKPVYEGFSAAQIVSKVAFEGLRPVIPSDCPWSNLMTACWRNNPADRPGFSKILGILSELYSETKKIQNNGKKYNCPDIEAVTPNTSLLNAKIPKQYYSSVDDMRRPTRFLTSNAAAIQHSIEMNRIVPATEPMPAGLDVVVESKRPASQPIEIDSKPNNYQQISLTVPHVPRNTNAQLESASRETGVAFVKFDLLDQAAIANEPLKGAAVAGDMLANSPSIRGRVQSDPLLSRIASMEANAKLRDEAGCRPVLPVFLNDSVGSFQPGSTNSQSNSGAPASAIEAVSSSNSDEFRFSPLTPSTPFSAALDSSPSLRVIPAVSEDPYSLVALEPTNSLIDTAVGQNNIPPHGEQVPQLNSSIEDSSLPDHVDSCDGGYDTT